MSNFNTRFCGRGPGWFQWWSWLPWWAAPMATASTSPHDAAHETCRDLPDDDGHKAPGLLDLPHTVIAFVVEFLPSRSALAVTGVCRQLRQVCRDLVRLDVLSFEFAGERGAQGEHAISIFTRGHHSSLAMFANCNIATCTCAQPPGGRGRSPIPPKILIASFPATPLCVMSLLPALGRRSTSQC